MQDKIYILGGGVLSEFIIDVLERKSIKPSGIFDDTLAKRQTVQGVPVIGPMKDALSVDFQSFICGIGSPQARKKIHQSFGNKKFISVVDDSAILSSTAEIGDGCIIGPHTCVLSGSKLDFGVCILANSSINQNTHVGAYSLIGAGCNIGNNVIIGEGAHIGLGSTVSLGTRLDSWSNFANH